MGDARNNPRSPQYTGPLPDVIQGADINWVVEPNAAFLARAKELRDAGVEGPLACEEHERDVVLYARAAWIVPMRTTQQYPTSHLAMAELARMPLIDFKKRHKGNFEKAGMQAAADTIVIPDEETPKLIVA